jgi:SAM-dependent methyltransferase
MRTEVNLLDRYPRSKRPIEERGRLIAEEHRSIARRFGREYFDGDRLTGYGGYNYHPRFWTETVRRFRDHYQLAVGARVLDVGCGKGFMLHDFKQLMPSAEFRGVDVSRYALENAMDDVRPIMQLASADELPFEDGAFDLVISINTIHNLPPERCALALQEIQRVCRGDAYVVVDAWRNEDERKALMKWNLTAHTYMHVKDWAALFDAVGYAGDYWWFVAQSD